MSYKLQRGMTYRLPSLTSTPKMKEASADQLRVLLCLAQSGYTAAIETLAKQCGISLSATAMALEYWLDAHVIEELDAPSLLVSDDLPHGSAAEDARVIREEELHGCMEACSQIMGKLLNSAEINILVAIIHELGVDEAYLTTLLDFCVNKQGKRNLRYIEKTAVALHDQGICTIEALDEYIRRYELVHSNEGQIRKLWGMGARELTQAERAHLDRWFNEYHYGMDVIGIAYDITVNSTGKPSIAYANKLLTVWYQNGLKTQGEIEAYLAAQKKNAPRGKKQGNKPKQQLATSSFDIDSAFELALIRSYGRDPRKDGK